MYASDVEQHDYMIATHFTNETTVKAWTEFHIDYQSIFYRNDSFFVVEVTECDDGEVTFEHLQTCRAYAWKDPLLSLHKLIKQGAVDLDDTASKILTAWFNRKLH